MAFGVFNLFGLTLKKEIVPQYPGIPGTIFPQRIPTPLMLLCFLNSLVKLSIPLILQQTYSSISTSSTDHNNYLLLIIGVLLAIAISQLVLIAYGLTLSLYQQNVKRQLSSRILQNNFMQYRSILQSPIVGDRTQQFQMQLWVKISTKLSVYLHNYYESYLSLIFQCFNIVVILIYLIYKLSFSLLFGLVIAGLIMYKTIKTAAEMNQIRFSNIALRARRLRILQQYFTRITDFKMCWLDQWVHDRVINIEHQFQEGLRKIKMLDCWCVALWQFTGVGISSIVITAYFLFGFNQMVGKDSVFTPSTFIYLLTMLNFPLNALSWYIAGIKTAQRAIHQIQKDIKTQKESALPYKKIQDNQGSLCVREAIELEIHQHSDKQQRKYSKIVIPIKEFRKGKIYSISGQLSEDFMKKLIFLFQNSIRKGYVEENAWLAPSALETFLMNQQIKDISQAEKCLIEHLMELFQCLDIPLSTNTLNYSGGQKLRISLVRAFNLGSVIVINTNLNSLDKNMKQKIKTNIRKLVHGCYQQISKCFTVFIRENQDFADQIIDFKQTNQKDLTLNFTLNPSSPQQQKVLNNIIVSPQIQQYIQKASQQQQSQRHKKLLNPKQQLLQYNQQKQKQQKSVVQLSTFWIYYKSKKHIIFITSMLAVTVLSNYYNFYVNTYINLAQYNQTQIIVIIGLTVLFAIGLFFRSYYFADANLQQASRICHDLNRNILMDQLSFYQSQQKIKDNNQTINSKSRLICALTSDTQTIADHFPFSTNILANNITVILSSVIVILLQVPQMVVLMALLMYYANRLNTVSHKRDEKLKLLLKEKEVQVYNVVSDIEGGSKYLIIHNKVDSFSQLYVKLRQEFMEIDWMSIKYRNYINLKYKIATMIFLVVGVTVYSFVNIFSTTDQSFMKSSGLALLFQYTIQLSNYLQHFTMSIWEIRGQAVSIQRVRPYLENKESINKRIASAEKTISKIKEAHSNVNIKSNKNDSIIDIKSLQFAYESNPDTSIFNDLNLSVNHGDKIIIKGRSGSGKTTLYKLLTSAYPSIMDLVTNTQYLISFSPQHPLPLPDTLTVQQNIDPYKIAANLPQIQQAMSKYHLKNSDNLSELSYEQKIVINNLRAYLYGYKGVIIYDQPQIVLDMGQYSTYLIVTHHHDFGHTRKLQLIQGKLVGSSDI